MPSLIVTNLNLFRQKFKYQVEQLNYKAKYKMEVPGTTWNYSNGQKRGSGLVEVYLSMLISLDPVYE